MSPNLLRALMHASEGDPRRKAAFKRYGAATMRGSRVLRAAAPHSRAGFDALRTCSYT